MKIDTKFLKKAALISFLYVGLSSAGWASTLEGGSADVHTLETAALYLFLRDHVLRNMRYVIGICSFIFTTVACFSQNMSSMIMNNLAYICYVVFGGAIIIKVIESHGLLVTML